MKKSNNIIFLIIIILISIIGFSTLIRNQKEISCEENRSLNKIPQLTIKSFLEGNYQKNLESSLSDQFLGSGTIKKYYPRIFDISTMTNMKKRLCHYGYFSIDTERAVYNCGDYIVFSPISMDLNQKNKVLESYKQLGNKVDTYYYYINTSRDINFKTNKKSTNVKQLMKRIMNNKYTYSELNISNYNDYKKYFYKNDHHWNYRGSYQGYLDILEMLNIDNPIKPIKKEVFDNYYYYGSHSQATRNYEYLDEFTVYKFKLPYHNTLINSKPGVYGKQNSFFQHKIPYSKNSGLYGEFYGWDYGEVMFNYHQHEKDNLLIISNSYSNAINELIASHFYKTYVIDLRNYKNDMKKEFNIVKYINDHSIDKVLIIMDYSYITSNEMKLKWGKK